MLFTSIFAHYMLGVENGLNKTQYTTSQRWISLTAVQSKAIQSGNAPGPTSNVLNRTYPPPVLVIKDFCLLSAAATFIRDICRSNVFTLS